MKNELKKFLTLGAALAGSSLMVSCDGDDVTVASPGQTGGSAGVITTEAPSASELAGSFLAIQRGTTNAGGVGLANTAAFTPGAGNVFASSSLLNTFPGQLAFTYSSTGNTFTLGNISVVGAAAVTPANQAALDTAVNNQGNIPIIIDADEALGTAAGNASNVSTSATPVIALGAGNTQLTLENLAYNNRLKNDANVELNGATGSLLPLAVAGGNIVDSTGTILLPVASINGIATSNYATYQGLAGVNGTVLDPDFATTAGITAVINVIQGNPAVFNTPQATALLPNLIAVQTNLNNIVSASTAAEAGLVTALNAAILTEGNDTVTGVGFLPELAISNWNATFTINDANNGADNGVILRGSYAETLDCTGYTAVKLTAASSGFLIGEYRIEPSTTVINKSNTGAFIGSEN